MRSTATITRPARIGGSARAISAKSGVDAIACLTGGSSVPSPGFSWLPVAIRIPGTDYKR